MAKRSTASLIKYVKFLMDAGAMERPVWLDAVVRMPPPPLPKHGKKPPTIAFPEDDLMRSYTKRHPEALLEPVNLASFDPPTPKRFALRQLELMKQGISRRDAFTKVEKEFAAAKAAEQAVPGWQSPGKYETIIEQIQSEEEAHLKQALKTYVDRHGHKPMSQMQDPSRPPRTPRRPTDNRNYGRGPPVSITSASQGANVGGDAAADNKLETPAK